MVFCKKAIRPAMRAGLLRTLRRIAKNVATVTFLLSRLRNRCASWKKYEVKKSHFCEVVDK
jgi:hypothetical protein